MGFLALLQANWKFLAISVVITFIFLSGWHLRGILDDAKQASAIIAQTKRDDKVDVAYNQVVTKSDQLTQNLNQKLKVVYENPSYRCPIPAGGVRLLQQANR